MQDNTPREPSSHGEGHLYEVMDLEFAYKPQTILAYEMNGKPLPIKHGAPLRLRVETQSDSRWPSGSTRSSSSTTIRHRQGRGRLARGQRVLRQRRGDLTWPITRWCALSWSAWNPPTATASWRKSPRKADTARPAAQPISRSAMPLPWFSVSRRGRRRLHGRLDVPQPGVPAAHRDQVGENDFLSGDEQPAPRRGWLRLPPALNFGGRRIAEHRLGKPDSIDQVGLARAARHIALETRARRPRRQSARTVMHQPRQPSGKRGTPSDAEVVFLATSTSSCWPSCLSAWICSVSHSTSSSILIGADSSSISAPMVLQLSAQRRGLATLTTNGVPANVR